MKSIPLKIAQTVTFVILLVLSVASLFSTLSLVLSIFGPESSSSQQVTWLVPIKMENKHLVDQENYQTLAFKPTKIRYHKAWLEVAVLEHKSFFQSMIYLAYLGIFAIGFPFYFFLFHILASVETAPFSKENVSRMKKMGLLVIGGELYRFFLFLYLSVSIVKQIDIPGAEIAPVGWTELNFPILFLGVIILILGEVFKRGFTLQENENLTV